MTWQQWSGDETDVYILTAMYNPPTNSIFCNEHGNTIKPESYRITTGYVYKGEMVNSYPAQSWTWKWAKKLFFHLIDLTILNSFLLLTSCGVRMTHTQFILSCMQILIEKAGSLLKPHLHMGRPSL